MPQPDYDAIIIGSGAGGLTAAVALAQAGQKVLVCEQHYVPGGWCHSFTLEGYRFSPGVHYIGGLEPGGFTRAIYQGLGVSGDIEFAQLNPDGYDHILVGDQRFDIPAGIEAYQGRLKARFPSETRGIDGLFAAIDRIVSQIQQAKVRSPLDALALPFRAGTLLRWFYSSAQAFVDSYVSDSFLKAILLGQTGDHGVPPGMASVPVHTSVMSHYFEGGYYPVGGGYAIPRAFTRALRRAGGELKLSTPVERILIEAGRAVGVRLGDGTELRARTVISNADPHMTFDRLVGRDHLSGRLRRKLDRITYSTSALSLFFATDMDLRAAGLDSGNVWAYAHPDIDAIYRAGYGDHNLGDGEIEGLFLTVTTLKDPSKMHSGHHTCEAFSFVGYDAFRRWEAEHASEGGPPHPADYAALKGRLIDKMLSAIERIVPGLRQHIVFVDLGTPLTNRYYLAATEGNLYGIDKRPSQIGPFAFPVRSEIEGLYMAGASTLSHGVMGATVSGLAAARLILGCRTSDLLRQAGPEIAIYPSEDVAQWPDARQRRAERGRPARELPVEALAGPTS